ncbi:hypothetical protein UlMin_003003 [Ulmus minor]
MSNFSEQLEEIKSSISSNTNKSFAYSTLLYLQEQSSSSPASIQTLAESSPSLIPLIVADVHEEDEEIAAQALKCLGFMMYHPSIVAIIPVDGANLVFESLVKLITMTRMKTVCNLGVWCISIQQFKEPVIAAHFHSLLQAVVHALDNPMGSLSTTFEAIQAVMRLAVQLGEKMRDLSHIWARPIFRRLISLDKRERDMTERCLLKIRSLLIPPSPDLSKIVAKDMNKKLLNGMKDMLNHGLKIQAVGAWGWFIRLLGSHALKNRHLVNEMLKIPEHTFSDHDPQVQIATQVAWEGLIDSLIHPSILPSKTNGGVDGGFEQMGSLKKESTEHQANGFSKSIKLIMTPLIGIMSSNCDASVHLSCFNTWCYLLHKLDSSVNCVLVGKLVLYPFFEAVYQIDPDCKSTWLWKRCIDLLNDSVSEKSKDVDCDSSNLASRHLSARTSAHGASAPGKCSWKQHSIKWLPWDLCQLDFFLRIILILINQASKETLSHEKRRLAYDASLRLFRSVIKGVQIDLKNSSTNYNDVLLCLNTLLEFLKNLCVENSEGIDRNELHNISLQLVEVVSEEIEPAILGSPLYKVALDLKYVESLRSSDETRRSRVLGLCNITYMDMVSPIVYLTVLYFSVMAQTTLNTPKTDLTPEAMQRYFKIMLSSYDPQEQIIVSIGLLYKNTGPSCLKLWTAIAEALKDYIVDVKNVSSLKMDNKSTYFAVCDLLIYPFIICFCHEKELMSANICVSSQESCVLQQRKLKLGQVIEAWNSLYGSLCTSQFEDSTTNNFSEDLCNTLNGWLTKYASMYESANEPESSHADLHLGIISFYGGVMICILEKAQSLESSPDESQKRSSNNKISNSMNSCLTLAIRILNLLQTKVGKDLPTDLHVVSRLYSALAHFISHLHLKQDILSVIEIISSLFLEWLACLPMQDESTNHQFQLLWTEMLNCLKRSQPPVVFDSAFIKLQAPLLEKTLDHPNPAISESVISFWDSTYGEQNKLVYPENLLHVLDKLSRNGRINLHKRSPPLLERCDSRPQVSTIPGKYRVNATNYTCSKRIELVNDTSNHTKHEQMPSSNLKRKRLELTEHQKEVRRAQQGRARDCGGHGLGGIKTYTNADFSQGNEDSQDSQELWNLESILETSKKS